MWFRPEELASEPEVLSASHTDAVDNPRKVVEIPNVMPAYIPS
jgi:hypothetical protein